jgi:hypothetical protein
LLTKNPTQRIQSAAQIKRHPWYKNMDWSSLAVKKIRPPFRITVKNIESAEHFDTNFTNMRPLEESVEADTTWQAFEDFDYAFQGV